MGKPREVHRQLELPKLDKNGQRRGGKRAGAGRKPNGLRAGAPHDKRPPLKRNEPVHVTLRVTADITMLRTRHVYHAVRWAMVAVFPRTDFRIVHLSIQGDHVHLLVEADDRERFANGLRSFESVSARYINQAIGKRTGGHRTGKVFADRYHERIINAPRDARFALRYVLSNWRKHGEDRRAPATRRIDPYSSAISFPGWAELGDVMWKPPDGYEPLPVWLPKSWLLSVGWQKAGPQSCWDKPGAA